MHAAVLQQDRKVKVEQRPIPVPGPKEILLKVVAVGQNPTDWKHAELITKPGQTMGCDFVGTVHSFGSEVPSVPDSAPAPIPTKDTDVVQKGQLRYGFVRGGYTSPHTGIAKGAFAEYIAVEWDLTGLVPENVSSEQAASIPIPYATAIQALYVRLKFPQYPAKSERGEWILIWSGSTAVGQYAIQLAKLIGLRVATTASQKKWDLMKKLGADVVVDYKDPDVVKKLKEGTNDSIQYGLDCISENGSLQMAQQAFRPSGGHLIAILFDLRKLPRPEVHTEATLAYVLLGEDHGFGSSPRSQFKTSPEERATYVKWLRIGWELFGKGLVKPLEVEVVGGLEDIQKGFDLMKEGKNRCRIVYKV